MIVIALIVCTIALCTIALSYLLSLAGLVTTSFAQKQNQTNASIVASNTKQQQQLQLQQNPTIKTA
jgi:hypothetical protein